MAGAFGRVRIASRLPQVIAESRRKAGLAVEKTARDIEAGAKTRTPPRVDTGLMMGAWTSEPREPFAWEVFTGVEYAPYHEWGTESIPAHPMLTPSVEEAREPFERALGEAWH